MKDVTAAVIIHEKKLLIAQRAPSDKMAGKWELPGGKIEQYETPEQCLRREIHEELEMDIEVRDFLGENIYKYEFGKIRLLAYFCRWISGEPVLKVHSHIEWVSCKDLERYEFSPADIPLIEKLKSDNII